MTQSSPILTREVINQYWWDNPSGNYKGHVDIPSLLQAQRDASDAFKDAYWQDRIATLEKENKELEEANQRQADSLEMSCDHVRELEDRIAEAVREERERILGIVKWVAEYREKDGFGSQEGWLSTIHEALNGNLFVKPGQALIPENKEGKDG